MTNQQAARVAVEAIEYAMKEIRWDANMALRDPNAPPGMKTRLKLYQRYDEALRHFRQVLAQGELEIHV